MPHAEAFYGVNVRFGMHRLLCACIGETCLPELNGKRRQVGALQDRTQDWSPSDPVMGKIKNCGAGLGLCLKNRKAVLCEFEGSMDCARSQGQACGLLAKVSNLAAENEVMEDTGCQDEECDEAGAPETVGC